jgi:hypothetical protein
MTPVENSTTPVEKLRKKNRVVLDLHFSCKKTTYQKIHNSYLIFSHYIE